MKQARSFVLAVTVRYNLSMDKNSRPKLTVIQGGRKEKEEWRRYFISAYTTDTRLMGALGLYVHWQAVQGDETADFHQFFYVCIGIRSYCVVYNFNNCIYNLS